MLGVGTMVWLASELMFFSGLFAAWYTLRAAAVQWPPPGVELETGRAAAFTLALVASSGTYQLAVSAVERGQVVRARRFVVLTMALGAVFVGNQALEWTGLDFSASSHAYGSAFYLLTGFHGLHVIGGILAMAALLTRLVGPRADPGAVAAVQVVGYYWHFVDAVWLAVFATVFLLG